MRVKKHSKEMYQRESNWDKSDCRWMTEIGASSVLNILMLFWICKDRCGFGKHAERLLLSLGFCVSQLLE